MGQQQLLLIILTVIVVGAAVYLGIVLFSDNSVSQNRAAMMNDLTTLAQRSRQYYMKAKYYGGGGRSFVGLEGEAGMNILAMKKFYDNENGTYSIKTAGTATEVVLYGVGKKALGDGVDYPEYECTVTSTGLTMQRVK